MTRLIDADDVINKINAYCKGSQDVDFIRKLVENQPTAYDAEKVVEELEFSKNCKVLFENMPKGQLSASDSAYDDAIEIVRKGGVNEK